MQQRCCCVPRVAIALCIAPSQGSIKRCFGITQYNQCSGPCLLHPCIHVCPMGWGWQRSAQLATSPSHGFCCGPYKIQWDHDASGLKNPKEAICQFAVAHDADIIVCGAGSSNKRSALHCSSASPCLPAPIRWSVFRCPTPFGQVTADQVIVLQFCSFCGIETFRQCQGCWAHPLERSPPPPPLHGAQASVRTTARMCLSTDVGRGGVIWWTPPPRPNHPPTQNQSSGQQ